MPNFRPFRDNVLVSMHSGETRTKSGLYLPATRKPHENQAVLATVIAAGPGYWADVKAVPDRAEPRDVDRVERIERRRQWIPVTVKPGETVVVDSPHCGDFLPLDVDDDGTELQTSYGIPNPGGKTLRVIRQAEIHCTVEGLVAGEAV